MTATDHDKIMLSALRLAQHGRGKVEPNPMVAALIVRRGRIIAQGYHQRFGGPHAEINALQNCPDSPAGATMYVTIEPCCHQGQTPPCTSALIRSSLARIVVATLDPSEKVAGRGVQQLRQAGVEVVVGPGGSAARRLNAAFFKLHRTGRPFVLLKWAQSLDGKIATRTGQSRWISNDLSRGFAHRLRRYSQAILVGVGTVLADDPLLTPRPALAGRMPLRIVVDSRLRIPPDSQLVRTAAQAPLLVATTDYGMQAKKDVTDALTKAGAELCPVCPGPGPVDLPRLLDLLGRRRLSNLLVEGGSKILTQFLNQQLADELCAFICPKLIGGKNAPGPFEGLGSEAISQALELENVSSRKFGTDLMIRGDLPPLKDYLYE